MSSIVSQCGSLFYLLRPPYISNAAPYIPAQMPQPAHSPWLTLQLLKSGLNPIQTRSIADKALTDRASSSPPITFSSLLLLFSPSQVNSWMNSSGWNAFAAPEWERAMSGFELVQGLPTASSLLASSLARLIYSIPRKTSTTILQKKKKKEKRVE